MLKITFEKEKETKNTIRFSEKVEDSPPVIGTLYVQKWALKQIGNPESIEVTINEK